MEVTDHHPVFLSLKFFSSCFFSACFKQTHAMMITAGSIMRRVTTNVATAVMMMYPLAYSGETLRKVSDTSAERESKHAPQQ